MTDTKKNSNSAAVIRGKMEQGLMILAQLDILKEEFKGVVDSLNEEFDLDKAIVRRVMKTIHKGDFDEIAANHKKFVDYVEAFKSAASPGGASVQTTDDEDED